jgi:hypothetical protein
VFDAEHHICCVTGCWVQFPNDTVYARAYCGHSYIALLVFFPFPVCVHVCVCVFFFLRNCLRKSNPVIWMWFFRFHWECNSGTKGLKKQNGSVWPGFMRRIEATGGLVNMWVIYWLSENLFVSKEVLLLELLIWNYTDKYRMPWEKNDHTLCFKMFGFN